MVRAISYATLVDDCPQEHNCVHVHLTCFYFINHRTLGFALRGASLAEEPILGHLLKSDLMCISQPPDELIVEHLFDGSLKLAVSTTLPNEWKPLEASLNLISPIKFCVYNLHS